MYFFGGQDEGRSGVAAIAVEAGSFVAAALRLLSLLLELLALAHRQHSP